MQSIRYSRRQSRGGVELNMAPLIDMIFILLIFFLVTTSFVRESGVEVNRPSAQTAILKQDTSLILSVTAEDIIYMEGKAVDVRAVQSKMERFLMGNPGASVVIAADRDSRSGTVIQVLDACRLAGAEKVSVAARRPEGP